jgi:hypothetical protein
MENRKVTKVYVAAPGITGFRFKTEVDISHKIKDFYYKSADTSDLITAAYCFKLENRAEVDAILNQMQAEEKELRDRHYKKIVELRKLYGV